MAAPHAVLLREMRIALLSELGARAIYADLARLARGTELASVLGGLEKEAQAQVGELCAVMRALGARPRARSRRRRLLAGALALASLVIGRRLVLRICAQAADRAARWYAYFQLYLVQAGLPGLASTCGRLAQTRRRHARALSTWVVHL